MVRPKTAWGWHKLEQSACCKQKKIIVNYPLKATQNALKIEAFARTMFFSRERTDGRPDGQVGRGQLRIHMGLFLPSPAKQGKQRK